VEDLKVELDVRFVAHVVPSLVLDFQLNLAADADLDCVAYVAAQKDVT